MRHIVIVCPAEAAVGRQGTLLTLCLNWDPVDHTVMANQCFPSLGSWGSQFEASWFHDFFVPGFRQELIWIDKKIDASGLRERESNEVCAGY